MATEAALIHSLGTARPLPSLPPPPPPLLSIHKPPHLPSMDAQLEDKPEAQVDSPLLLSEKAPLPLAVVPPAQYVRPLQALNALYFIQVFALSTGLDPERLQYSALSVSLGLAVGTAHTRWAARRQRQRRAKLALEEGWTVADHAEKDKEEMDKANVGRRRCVWIFAVMNLVLAGMVGTLFVMQASRA